MENTKEKFGLIRQGTVLRDSFHCVNLIVISLYDDYYCGNGKYILLQYENTEDQFILQYDRLRDRIFNGAFYILSY